VALAFSMFGYYEIQLPSGLQSKITNISNKQEGGNLIGVAIMGFLSALIPPFCPTIMPDKIGIIGNTQGVNESNKPKPKKLANTHKILSCCNKAVILLLPLFNNLTVSISYAFLCNKEI
jgi:hypothetical protein